VRHYATVCRGWQLPVLLESMRRHCGDFTLDALAWDFEADRNLGPEVYVQSRAGFLAKHPECAPERLPGPPRSPIDTVATVRWAFFFDVMKATRAPLTTLDGDLWFWSSPEPMFDEIGDAPMAVCPHGIPPRSFGLPGVCYETHRRYGLYNSGLVYFGLEGAGALAEMAEATREWSYTEVRQHPEDGQDDFGDQGALERIARRHGAREIIHPGVNVAPWNIHHRDPNMSYARTGDGQLEAEVVVVGRPLVVYHYSSLRFQPNGRVLQWADEGYAVSRAQQRLLYWPYVEACSRQLRAARAG